MAGLAAGCVASHRIVDAIAASHVQRIIAMGRVGYGSRHVLLGITDCTYYYQ